MVKSEASAVDGVKKLYLLVGHPDQWNKWQSKENALTQARPLSDPRPRTTNAPACRRTRPSHRCYAMLCLCCAMPCYAMLCYAAHVQARLKLEPAMRKLYGRKGTGGGETLLQAVKGLGSSKQVDFLQQAVYRDWVKGTAKDPGALMNYFEEYCGKGCVDGIEARLGKALSFARPEPSPTPRTLANAIGAPEPCCKARHLIVRFSRAAKRSFT